MFVFCVSADNIAASQLVGSLSQAVISPSRITCPTGSSDTYDLPSCSYMSVEDNIECPNPNGPKANVSCITVEGSQVSGVLNVNLPAENIAGPLNNPSFSVSGNVCQKWRPKGTNVSARVTCLGAVDSYRI